MRNLPIDPEHPYADFRNFLYAVFMYLGLSANGVPGPTRVQYDIAHYLQHGPKRAIIEAFRGVGKSWITVAYVLWILYWDKDMKILVVSASKGHAANFTQFCLQLLRGMPELQHMQPTFDQRRSTEAFDIAGCAADLQPSVKSIGINGQMPGNRADLIVADDVEVPKNSQTQEQREKLSGAVKEFDAILKPLEHATIKFLGTPQTEMSLYNALGERGYDIRIWPARKPNRDEEIDYGSRLAPLIAAMAIAAGLPTDPARFDAADLAGREASYGKSGFALQFMLSTKLSDALRYPLKCRDFIVMDVDAEVAPVKVSYGSGPDQALAIECVGMQGDRWYGPMYVSKEMSPYQASVMYIDPAGRGKDRTAFVIAKLLNGYIYVTRIGSFEGGYDDTVLTALSVAARQQKVNKVIVESNFGDGMFNQLLAPYLARIHPCSLEEDRNTKQKEVRIIDTLEPVLNQHKLVIDRAMVSADMNLEVAHQLFYQLTRLTKEKGALAHDDLLDALAGAVKALIESLGVDHSEAEEKYKQAALDAEIARWLENATGRSGERSGPNWRDGLR